MSYKALTYVNLPPDNRKVPGDTITDEELEAAGQTKKDIKALVDSGAIGSEGDPIDESHAPVAIAPSEASPGAINVITGELGGAEDSNV